MDLKITDTKDISLSFVLDDSNLGYANLLRRTMIRDIAVYAIDTIVVYENTTELFDEYIAHRIGLVPLVTPKDADKKPRDVVLTLDAAGPSMVYSKDLKSGDSVVEVALENIPLFAVAEKKSIRIECKAKVGYGKQHAKFQAGIAAYEQVSEDKYNFMLESSYQKKPEEILREGLAIIKNKTEEYIKIVEEFPK